MTAGSDFRRSVSDAARRGSTDVRTEATRTAAMARREKYCVGHAGELDIVTLETDDELAATTVLIDHENGVVGISLAAWLALEADGEACDKFAEDLQSAWPGVTDLSSKDYFLRAWAAYLEDDGPMDRLRDLCERLQALVIAASGCSADPRVFAERKVAAMTDLLALEHEVKRARQLLEMLDG